MYIRRKVFSRFVDESGEERLFSTTEYTNVEQKEFGNKENKAAKRKWEMEQGRKLRGSIWDDEKGSGRNRAEKDIHAARTHRDLNNATIFRDDVKNVDQAINYREFHTDGWEETAHSKPHNKSLNEYADKVKKKLNEGLHEKGSKYNRNLKFNKAKRDINKFVKDNKKGLAIGGAALGTAALVGGIALHKHNKKKKEEQEKKN